MCWITRCRCMDCGFEGTRICDAHRRGEYCTSDVDYIICYSCSECRNCGRCNTHKCIC